MSWINLSKQQFLQLKFIGCLLFVIGILLSKAILSLTTVYLIIIVLLSGEYKNWSVKLIQKNTLFPFLFYVVWTWLSLLWSDDIGNGLKTIISSANFYLIPPLLVLTTPIEEKQRAYILQFFGGLVVVISLINFAVFHYKKEFVDIRSLSIFISHIRFSICVVIASVILTYLAFKMRRNSIRLLLYVAVAWLVFYTYYAQVLSGVLGYIGVFLALIIIKFYTAPSYRMKGIIIFMCSAICILMSLFIFSIFHQDNKFLNINALPTHTKQGHLYSHDVYSSEFENGNPLNCYLCVNEMDSTWMKRSSILLDRSNQQGFSNRTVLIRYLTSKGLPKDAEGVNALNQQDIKNVELGIPSILQLNKGMYARYYALKYELSQNDDPNGHSLLQRFEFWKTALHIIRNNFILGVGIGDYESEYRAAYDELKSPLINENRLGSHNQFMYTWLNFGVIGFLLFCWLLIKPFRSFLKSASYLSFILLIILICSFLVEDTLGTLTGMSLFSFFYGLNLQNIGSIVDN
jgi:hypothetical protein